MKEKVPEISVIMSNYNTKESYLRESIESILNQTFNDFEFIIIDDNSTSNSIEIIESYKDKRIKILRNDQNLGLASSLNKGIRYSKGNYIARMDADDVSINTRLEKQFNYLENNKDIHILGTKARIFGEKKGIREIIPCTSEYIRTEFLFTVGLTHPSIMMRKEFINKFNLFYNEEFIKSQDYEFWSRCAELGKLYEYPEVLLNYRVSNTQASIKYSDIQNHYANLVRIENLKKLGIYPTKKQIEIHYSLSRGIYDEKVDLIDMLDWCKILLDSNNKSEIYPKMIFEKILMKHLLVIIIKFLKGRKSINHHLFSHYVFKKFLSIKFFPTYATRLMASLRFKFL